MKTKIINILKWIGLGFLEPVIRLISGDDVKENTTGILKKIVLPVVGILLFIAAWGSFSTYLKNTEIDRKITKIEREQGAEEATKALDRIKSGIPSEQPEYMPSPSDVWTAYGDLMTEHRRIKSEKEAHYIKTEKINKKRKEQGKSIIEYTGPPSFIDQIKTSLFTVFCGFLLALVIAVPIGIVMGLNETIRDAINPFIQVFKPVSPVVWYLLVFMIVKTVLADSDADKAFIISFIAVGLCSMWATLVNTAQGVSSVDKDILNVSKVLSLSTFEHVFKVVLPASFPMIFTGLRITMSVSWMVLIAIELLSQSPGLGTFVWEEYQGGASDGNAKIIVAMFVIGGIGFLLDRIMLMLQNLMSFEDDTLS